jgi:hypothetical protein
MRYLELKEKQRDALKERAIALIVVDLLRGLFGIRRPLAFRCK